MNTSSEVARCGAQTVNWHMGTVCAATFTRVAASQAAASQAAASQAAASPLAARASGEARLEQQRAALRGAFEREGAALLGVLRAYIRRACVLSGGEAGEIAGEMLGEWYEEAMKSAARFDPQRSAVAWLLGIGYHLALRKSCERGRRASRETLCADLPRGDHEDASDAFERVACEEARLCDPLVPLSERERETRAALQHLVSSLSPADRQALCDAVRAGGAPCGADAAARQRLCRARKRLQQAHAHTNA